MHDFNKHSIINLKKTVMPNDSQLNAESCKNTALENIENGRI